MSRYAYPILFGAILITVVLSYRMAYEKGRSAAEVEYKAQLAGLMQESQRRRDAEAERAAKASVQLAKADAQAETIYQTITKTVDRIVEKPIYRNVCLDADGVRSVNAALAGSLAVAGQPDSGLPDADAAQ